ncbi:S8 family serine peptidase [Ruminococcus sp.]|uniref:S8 family serine peptidase n=3 Tax=Ruminococcus sp. TaxID=41978 RepID=UPI002675C407|nr:S8 family serine peptidase [uncultured Ruminococcus sp.]
MNSKKIVALLLCLGLSFQSTALSGVLYDENAVVKASAEESGKTADAEGYSGTEQSENKAQQPESSADKADKTQHAYDPISDMEAEQEYRDSTEITPGKVLFSVLSYHAEGEESAYLDDDSDICAEYDLKDVEFILETKAENTAEKDGMTPYKTFYEATTSEDVWATVDKLSYNENILSAEPDFVWEKTDTTTVAATDEEINAETHFPCMDVTGVWKDCFDHAKKEAPGKGTVVAVIDTGVDYTHKDLADNIWVNEGEIPGNGIDDDGNGYVDDVYGVDFVDGDSDPMDEHGHGTHVAGIIAMTPGNGGGVGVAYGAKIMCVRAGQANGSFASSDIAKAIKYAADNGADVINMSFGGTGRSYLVESALQDAFPSCVLVAAAGNDGLPTNDAMLAGYLFTEDIYPAGYKYVLGVMATDNNKSLASFSNWDFAEGSGCEYEMAAPGVNIYSTLPGNRYACWSGTSMATPNVAAAAAILRSKYTDKSKYSSRYIMGQLCSATSSKVDFVGKNGDHHSYPVLNIRDSLIKQTQPNLSLDEIYTLDYQDVSSVNNGDGIAQPGETIDMGVAVWNRWGAATDVTVKVDADSVGGVANKYVEFINDEVKLSDVGTFASVNNGFTYTDEKLTGISNPIRFKIKEGTPNDIQITFNISITAKNGLDERDGNLYSSSASYTLTVQNGIALSGIINEDMTLTNDKLWILENNVLIPEGVTVTVEPGTRIQFWSADPNNKYGAKANVYLQVEGRFIAEGTEEQPIEMYPGKGFEDKAVTITGQGDGLNNPGDITDNDYSKSFTSLKYVRVINANSTKLADVYKAFVMTKAEHCRFIQNYWDNNKLQSIIASTVSYTSFINHKHGFLHEGYGIMTGDFIGNILDNCDISVMPENNINDNVILNYVCKGNGDDPALEMLKIGISDLNNWSFINNAMLNSLYINDYNDIRSVGSAIAYYDPNGRTTYDISGNYWGTTNPDLVKVQCLDADWDVARNDLIQEPYLTLDDDMSDIYPFVTEAYLTDKDGNRIDKVSGAQTVKMHVKFNRDMASDIQPTVTYGGSKPYTDFAVSGDWANAREWVSEFKIDPYIDLGTMYIRVKGAAAADDKWLVTGNDWGRFKFEITNSSAQSMSLTGEGQLGKNALSWMQDDYDTLAGYNIYRATSYDANKKPEEQNFTKVNKSVLNADELSFVDENVKAGTDYYYYFTVVDTDLNESKASNVVSCCPLEGEPPVIVHTPVKTLTPDKAIAITADITDNVKVAGATLYYKNKSADSWKSVDMRNTTGSVYKATIAAYEVTDEDILYYITATDGANVGYCGTADEPNVIVPHYVTGIEIVSKPDKLNYDLKQELDSKGMVVKAVYNDGTRTAVSDYTLQGFDSKTEGEKTVTVVYNGFTAEFTVTVKHTHEYYSEITKQPTCSEKGERTYKCDICGDIYTEDIAKTEHDYEDTVVKPTCTERGYTEHICKVCADSYKDDYTPALGHDHISQITKQVACETDGEKTFTCTRCGDTYTEAIPATGHNDIVTVVEPTCTADGYTEHKCKDCGRVVRSDVTKALGHDYDSKITTKASCTEDGVLTYICTRCDESYTEKIPATGHKYNDVVTEASCDKGGYTLHTCANCGDSYKDNFIAPTGHKYTKTTVKQASCETDGVNVYTCDTCGDSYSEVIKAKGHVYASEVTKKANCTDDGVITYTCANCGDKYTKVIKAKGHNYSAEVTKKATCDTDGVKTFTCADCGDVYTEKLEALGHTYGISEVVKPTCDNDGYTKFTCSVCGDSYSKVINATGHKYNDKIVSASCDKSGYTLHTCENCGDIYKDNFTSQLGHDYTSQTVKPTCETDGEKTFTCTRCGDTYTEVIKAKGHVYKRTVVAAGCETDGYTLVECMECHDSFREGYVGAKGHTIVTDKAVAATCTTAGKTEGSHCSVCGKVIKAQTEIKAKGHVAGDWITDKAAAVGVKGRKHRSCTVCGAVVESADIPALSPKSISSASVSLSIATYSFDGKVKTPSVTVKLGSTALRNGIDYVVSYRNNKNVGKATVVITGKGLYAGTITRTFVINPAKQEIQKLTAKSKGFYIDYAAKGHATGYEIQYATNSSFSRAKKTVITSNKTDKVTISKLSGNKKYYVRVRTYTTVNGIKYYGAWSAVKTVTTKK